MVGSEFWEDHVWLFFGSQSPVQGLTYNECLEEHFLGSGSIPSVCSHPLNGHVNWLIPYPEKQEVSDKYKVTKSPQPTGSPTICGGL